MSLEMLLVSNCRIRFAVINASQLSSVVIGVCFRVVIRLAVVWPRCLNPCGSFKFLRISQEGSWRPVIF